MHNAFVICTACVSDDDELLVTAKLLQQLVYTWISISDYWVLSQSSIFFISRLIAEFMHLSISFQSELLSCPLQFVG